MIEQLLNAATKGATKLGKAIAEHFAKHGTNYIIGAGGAAIGGGAGYAIGKSIGHTAGKKEGTVEQATRDEKEMSKLHRTHESDREKWEKQKNEYEDLLGQKVTK